MQIYVGARVSREIEITSCGNVGEKEKFVIDEDCFFPLSLVLRGSMREGGDSFRVTGFFFFFDFSKGNPD